jgi:23S rRNA (adenine2503-C2)-methyltransferase
MTDLPLAFRRSLAEHFLLTPGEIVRQMTSSDGLTSKLLVRLADGEIVETVAMRAPARGASSERLSICVSTQAGCAMGCTFCATGQIGFSRHLDAGEIVCQVYLGSRVGGRPVTNVVFMGMGEPLANYDQTIKAVRLLHDSRGLGLSARAMTISTVGLVPQIRRLAREGLPVNLAISLHAPFDDERSAMMPVNRRWPIQELVAAGDEYAARTGRRVSYEYVLIQARNDSPEHARALGRLLAGRLCHVNLIPLNPTLDLDLRGTDLPSAVAFQRTVQAAGVPCTIRVNRGRDIDAACGQLRLREQRRGASASSS